MGTVHAELRAGRRTARPTGDVEVVRPGELDAADLAVWRTVQASSPALANPFLAPEFTLAVGAVRPRARVAVLSAGGERAGFLPYESGVLGTGRAIGAGVSDCQGVILRDGHAWNPGAVLRSCGLSAWEFDNLAAGQKVLGTYSSGHFASPVMDVGEGYDAYETWLRAESPKYLRTTLAKERRVGRDVGAVRFVFDERDPRALGTLMAWKSAQYRRTGRRDRFAQEWISRLVGTLHSTRSDGFAGVLSVLYAADRPVAAHFGLCSPTVLACWFPSYDPRFAKYSPGLILHLRMAEAAAAAGVRYLELGRGPAEYKEALKTRDLTVSEGVVTRPGPGALLRRIRRDPVRLAHDFVRERPRLAAAAERTLRQAGRLRRD